MKKSNKLRLEQIRVHSFVTAIQEKKAVTIKGGTGDTGIGLSSECGTTFICD